MAKRIINIFYLSLLTVILLYFILPSTWLRISDITRGNELINNINQYKNQNDKLPQNGDWSTLKDVGFTEEELNRFYPAYEQLNDTVFQLIFFIGFDCPYLYWNSNDQVWKEGCPL